VAIIPPAPPDVWSCKLLAAIRAKSTPEYGAAEKAALFIEIAAPLADLTNSGPFKNYTLHNRDHSKKLLHLAEFLMSDETLQKLSILDLLVIVYSAYLHDLGMSLTETERARILATTEFTDLIQEWSELSEALSDARRKLSDVKDSERFPIEAEIFQLQEAALVEYLRPRHATAVRYRGLTEYLKTQANRDDLFKLRGVPFEDILIDICVSHNLDVSVLAEVKGPYDDRFPRNLAVGGVYLNAQFCAAMLRLTDIMDFDRERTPRVLFESLGIQSRSLPGAEVTLLEWQKHMAVHSLEINQDEIVVSADSNHPVIEKTIREFSLLIEREIRDTLAVLKRNPFEITKLFQIDLPISVRPHIRSLGYLYKDMSLSLNQSRIMSMLMGERLYSTPAVAARELLQNSIDACSLRLQLEGDAYSPEISLAVEIDEYGRRWLQVRDNGNGMDEHVLSEYFLKLGSSYYSSTDFVRILRQAKQNRTCFTPISRFGIGLVSTFLICDVIEVRTRSVHSPRDDHEGRTPRIEKLGMLVFLTEQDSVPGGTSIRMRLLPKFNDDFEAFAKQTIDYLKAKILRPRFNISVHLQEAPTTLRSRSGIVLRQGAHEALAKQNVEMILLDIGRWSDRFSGYVVILLAKTEDGMLSHLKDGQYLRIGNKGIDPNSFLVDFPGNRITVNGFAMSLRKASKFVGLGKNRPSLILDVDIRGDESIEYDISRERIIGRGAQEVKLSLHDAIWKGLRDTGIVNRLTRATRDIFDPALRFETTTLGSSGPNVTPELLERVLALVPTQQWTSGMHRTIASKLEIPRTLAWRALDTLLQQNKITLPNTTKNAKNTAAAESVPEPRPTATGDDSRQPTSS
jgi:molecular chaperone HtpG